MIGVVMGVTGSGKTTVGNLLAEQLGWEFADADNFHSAANVEKNEIGDSSWRCGPEPVAGLVESRH